MISNFSKIFGFQQLASLTKEIETLSKYCQQTEQAMTYLEALVAIAAGEEKINSLKNQLKEEKEQYRQEVELARKWVQTYSSTAVRFTAGNRCNSLLTPRITDEKQ